MCPLHEQPVMIELTVKGTVFISDPKDLGIVVLAAKMQTDNLIRQSMYIAVKKTNEMHMDSWKCFKSHYLDKQPCQL